MSRTWRWFSSFGYINSELGDANKLSLVGCCSFFIHCEAHYLSYGKLWTLFTFTHDWTKQFIRESSPSYTQTWGSQPDAQQNVAEFQLQIIIWAGFPPQTAAFN